MFHRYSDLITLPTTYNTSAILGLDNLTKYYNTTQILGLGNLTNYINASSFNESVDDRVAVLIQNGTGITWSYNDTANTLTPTVTAAGTGNVTGNGTSTVNNFTIFSNTAGTEIKDSGYSGSSFFPKSSTISGDNLTNITWTKVDNIAVTSAQITDYTINATDISNYTITGLKIANETINGTQVTNYSLNASELSNYTITGLTIANATINATQIGGANITQDQAVNTTSNVTFNNITGLTQQQKCFAYYNITNSSDFVFDTNPSSARTITRVFGLCTGGTNVTGMLEIHDQNGTYIQRVNTTDWIFSNNTGLAITSFGNATYPINSSLYWNTTAQNGSPSFFTIKVYYN